MSETFSNWLPYIAGYLVGQYMGWRTFGETGRQMKLRIAVLVNTGLLSQNLADAILTGEKTVAANEITSLPS